MGKRSKQRGGKIWAVLTTLLVLAVAVVFFVPKQDEVLIPPRAKALQVSTVPSYVDVQIIDKDGDSRRGTKLTDVNDIVVHYVGNPGTTAQQNRDYYTNDDSTVSSHFVVGLEGEIIQCLPLDEISSASNHRNADTISIEVCHPDKTGKFTEATYNSLVKLTAWLASTCSLEGEHIIRHYDVTEKECPLYFVENEDKWLEFKEDVVAAKS